MRNVVSIDDRTVLNNLLMLPTGIDALDARLIRALCDIPRAGVMELARQLGVARGTVQARLDKLQQRGIISGFDPDLDLRAMGYEVLAFVSLEIAQGRLFDVAAAPARDPRGARDPLGDRAGRPAVPGGGPHQRPPAGRDRAASSRSTASTAPSTQIALTEQLRHRVLPLVELVIDATTDGDESAPRADDADARS